MKQHCKFEENFSYTNPRDGHQPELSQFCGEYPCTIWKRGCMVHGCSNRKTVRTDHKAMLLTDT